MGDAARQAERIEITGRDLVEALGLLVSKRRPGWEQCQLTWRYTQIAALTTVDAVVAVAEEDADG